MLKFLLSFFTILTVSLASAQHSSKTNYDVNIKVHEEGYFDVVENYDVNFHYAKHGIYRTIQTKYDLVTYDGKETKRKIIISNIDVPGHRFEYPGKLERRFNNDIKIRIGDPNRTVTGDIHYEIRYRVENAFLHEDDRIWFYWNVKPDGWSANFDKINFNIELPGAIALGDEDYYVYSGAFGTTTPSEEFILTTSGNSISGVSKEDVVSYSGDSVTVLINLPANSIAEYVPFWPAWTQYLWIGIIGLLIIGFYMVWDKHGRDDRVVSTSSYYPPEGIDPAMAGFLIDDREDSVDLIALLPDWGRRGLIEIEEIPKKNFLSKGDTKITRIGALPSNAPDYEKKIFSGLFGSSQDGSKKSVLVSSLRNTFYTTMSSAQKKLKKQAQIYYVPKSTRVKWITVWVLLGVMVVFGVAFLFIWGVLAAISLFVTTVVLLIMSTYLVKKNPKGNKVLSELKGFKRFIAVSEERKLKMLIQDDPKYFESTMSYALAFGLFAKWSRKFEQLNTPPPGWYSSSTHSTLTMSNFSNSFNSAMTSTRSTMVSSPSSSSSGGGSSGGGFGGGGGGSW